MLLLDEIEKAHPDVFNILLQVMDHATLTDNNGRKADFRNVVLMMTTNAGAHEMSARRSASAARRRRPGNARKAIERAFSPEFRNRLDAWVSFESLPADVVARIVDKFVAGLAEQLLEKKVVLELAPAARAWFAEHGFDPKMRRPPHGPAHPERDQEAAGREDPVRRAAGRRQGPRRPRSGGRPAEAGGGAHPGAGAGAGVAVRHGRRRPVKGRARPTGDGFL